MTIVVLGGGISPDGNLPVHSIARLRRAIQEFKKREGENILVCGRYSFLYPKNALPKKTEAQASKEYLVKNGIPWRKVYMENTSKDTIGNAYYAKKQFFIPKKTKHRYPAFSHHTSL